MSGSSASNSAAPKVPLPVCFCPVYLQNPAGAVCKQTCGKLHLCRKWIGGYCSSKECEFSHNFNSDNNLFGLRKAGIVLEAFCCHDSVRRRLRSLFPVICSQYNKSTGCKNNESCSQLHLCRELVLKGHCKVKPCRLNHAATNSQCKPIFEKFKLSWKTCNELNEILRNCVVPDEPRFISELNCNCSSDKSGSVTPLMSLNVSRVSSYDSINNLKVSDKVADKPQPPIASRSNWANGTIPSLEKLNIRDFVQAISSGAPFADDNDPVNRMTASIAYLIVNGLVVPCEQFRSHVNFIANPAVPATIKSLRQLAVFKQIRHKLPITFEWNGSSFVSMLNVFRACPNYNSKTGCNDTRCEFIHICKLFVAGVCQNNAECRLSHSLVNPVFPRLGCDSLSIDRRLALIRVSHPLVCAQYAYGASGCNDSNCVNMHVCNEPFLGVACISSNCAQRKDHSPTSSRWCKVRLTRFGLASEAASYVDAFFLPTMPPNVRPVVPSLAVPSNSGYVDAVGSQAGSAQRHASNSSSQEPSYQSKTRSFAQQLAEAMFSIRSGSAAGPRTLTLANLVAFLLCNRLTIRCSRIFHEFNLPFAYDKSATMEHIDRDPALLQKLNDLLKSMRESACIAKPLQSRMPVAYVENGINYVSMLRMFRICKNGLECIKRDCAYLHVCKLYVAGLCKTADSSCPYGDHESSLMLDPVFQDMGLQELEVERRRKLVFDSHPQVCAAYAYASCANQNCKKLHCCNEFILGLACQLSNCPYEHNLLASRENFRCLTRYGIYTSDASVRNLILPVAPLLSSDHIPPTAHEPEVVTEVLQAPPDITFAAQRQDVHSLPKYDECNTVTCDSDSPAVCERYLRGLCDNSALVHDGLIHFSQPFCWVCKLPLLIEVIPWLRSDIRKFKTINNDGTYSYWFAFTDEDNLLLESSFSDPKVLTLKRTIDKARPYAFAGDSEITFGNERESSSRMVTCLKRLMKVETQGAVISLSLVDETDKLPPSTYRVVALSVQMEFELHCFRTPSYCMQTPNSTRSTYWRWFYKVAGDETWKSVSELVGDNESEVELAYVNQCSTIALPRKEHCQPGGGGCSDLERKHYKFDFNTMSLSSESSENSFRADLCSRPIAPGLCSLLYCPDGLPRDPLANKLARVFQGDNFFTLFMVFRSLL